MSGERTLRIAQRAIAAGRAADARRLLEAYVQEHPDDYRPWLWLSGLTSSPGQSLRYLERAERLNPDDPAVAKARAWTEELLAAKSTPAAPAVPVTPTAAPPAQPAPSSPPAPSKRSKGKERPHRTKRHRADAVDRLRSKMQAQQRPAGRPPWLVSGLLLLLLAFVLGGAVAFVVRAQEVERPDVASDEEGGGLLPGVKIVADLRAAAEAEASRPSPLASPTPVPTNTPLPTPTLHPTATPVPTVLVLPDPSALEAVSVAEGERWINVDLSAQTLTAYEGATPVFQTLVSSGLPGHETVTGQFRIWLRYESQTMDGRLLGYDYYLEDVPYVMYFYQDYALHGTYWHNNFGRPMSHGCVNLATPDAEWLFHWSTMGTLVNVHS